MQSLWPECLLFLDQENSCPVAKEYIAATQAGISEICCFLLKMRGIMKKYAFFIYL